MSLTQNEFNHLISLDKRFVDDDPITFGNAWCREIVTDTTKDSFLLDFRNGNIELSKFTYNKRYRKNIVLVRLCSTGRHTNPDLITKFDGPHLHVFQEGLDDKVAFPVSTAGIDEASVNRIESLLSLLTYCNVAHPSIQTSIGDNV